MILNYKCIFCSMYITAEEFYSHGVCFFCKTDIVSAFSKYLKPKGGDKIEEKIQDESEEVTKEFSDECEES